MDGRETLAAIERITEACDGLSVQETLEAIEIAWLCWAANARNEALSVPGGFAAEQGRQVTAISAMLELVKAAAPDMEMERLHREGNTEGVLKRLQDLQKRGGDVQ
jgi:hypothetical protein